jgi:hypothetical protein
MLCPWCMHYGAEDDEYVFDEELYCGLCAQRTPENDEQWAEALRGMDMTALASVEEELNHIAVSKSGLQPDLLAEMGEGLAALAALRESTLAGNSLPINAEHVRWVRFACTYFAPRMR